MNKLLAIVTILGMTACAGFKNQIASNGGVLGQYPGDYIIRNDSGGKIMDVWKLKNVYVQNGIFKDQNGNLLVISGDLRIMRVYNSPDWDRYHEYHTEFETKTYQELYATK